MLSIKNNCEKIFIIKKSKFITKLYNIQSEEEKDKILEEINKQYNDATHICYFYKIDGLERATDDGEPSGTFTKPIINFVKNKNLNYILIIVIRYFGGIKLGASGLMRTYLNVVVETFNDTATCELEIGYKIKLILKYDDLKLVDYILKNKNNIKKEFNNDIIYTLNVDKNTLAQLQGFNPIIIQEVVITK